MKGHREELQKGDLGDYRIYRKREGRGLIGGL